MTRNNPALGKMIGQGRKTAQQAREEPAAPPPAPAPAPARREPAEKAVKRSVGTRLPPELHSWVRHTVLDLSDELGHRVYVEQVLEALLRVMRDDPALRERVKTEVRRG